MSPALSCAEAEPLLPLVADGVLSPDDDPGLFAHVARCPECQESLLRHDLVTLAVAQGSGRKAIPLAKWRVVSRLVGWGALAAGFIAAAWLGLGPSPSPEVPTIQAEPVAPPASVVRLPTNQGQAPLYLIDTPQGSRPVSK